MNNLQVNSLTIDDAIKLVEKVNDWKRVYDEESVFFLPVYITRFEGSFENNKILIDKETLLFSSEYLVSVYSGGNCVYEPKASDRAKMKELFDKVCSLYIPQKTNVQQEAVA